MGKAGDCGVGRATKIAMAACLALWCAGCSKAGKTTSETDTSPDEDATQDVQTPQRARFEDWLHLWEAGKRDDAVRELGKVDWDEVGRQAGPSVLLSTEKEWLALPKSQQSELMRRVDETMGPAREVVRYVRGLANESIRNGQYPQAERHAQTILRFARFLMRSDALRWLGAYGRGFRRMALNVLVDVYEKTGDPLRLQEVKEELSRL